MTTWFMPLAAGALSVSLLACASHPVPCPSAAEPKQVAEPEQPPPPTGSDRSRVMARKAAVHPNMASPDEDTVRGEVNLHDGFPARNSDGSVNVVIEIPAGTTAKFEIEPESGDLKLEYRDGKPRLIDFLPYPGNYGSIPRTLVDPAAGGDGDPLDVFVLGPALERGQLVRARIIGALKMIDRGEIDDKLLAVPVQPHIGGLAEVNDMTDLERRYPGAKEILATWLVHYKPKGLMHSRGWASAEAALVMVDTAARAFEPAKP